MPPTSRHSHVHYIDTAHSPRFGTLHYWRQLQWIADQHELPATEQRPQARRLQHLRRLVDDADVERSAREDHVIGAQTRGRHDPLSLGEDIR